MVINLVDYKDFKTRVGVVLDDKSFAFPSTGAKVLLKPRPPLAKEVKTD